MQRGFYLTTPRQARYATSIPCNSDPASPTGEHYGVNTPLAPMDRRARERNWCEGRIAKCPRLQQKPSVLLVPELSDIVSCSSPLRRVKPMACPIVRSRISAYPLRRSPEHSRP
jgi:hypothetical protein